MKHSLSFQFECVIPDINNQHFVYQQLNCLYQQFISCKYLQGDQTIIDIKNAFLKILNTHISFVFLTSRNIISYNNKYIVTSKNVNS